MTYLQDYKEATLLNIIRPQTAPKGKTFDVWITASSPKWQRLAVVQLTRYLCLETKYRQDLNEDAASWKNNNTAVFAITGDVLCRYGQERQALVGMMTFHQFHHNPVLYHCYIHPFFRSKGLMKDAWKMACIRYPAFEIESPLSPAMEGFLAKVDISQVLTT